MRLHAIELDQVATFSKRVRIDNIGPGLNVLAGANELGKSTLLRSLTALFVDQHRTTRQAIRDLRPYTGGAPFIACSFDLGGHEWRLEKRYLSAHRALLQRLDGHERHEGADAENRLTELLAGAGDLAAGLPLLWVGQGLGTELPAITDGVRHALGQLLAAQAENTAGVDRAQAVLGDVAGELDSLVTKTGKARKNSSYDKLLSARAEVEGALDDARRQTHEAEQRLVRLGELQASAAELSDRDVLAARQAQVVASEERLREAQDAQRKLQQLDERVAFLESQHKQRQATLAAYDDELRERATLAAAMEAANVELSDIATARAALDEQLRGLTQTLAAGSQRADVLRRQREEMRTAQAQAQRQARLQQLDGQAQRLATIAADLERIATEAAAYQWPQGALSEVRAAATQFDQLRARQDAQAPRVRVAYEVGRKDGFRLNGADLTDGADVVAGGPIAIEVEGVGRIEIIPAAGETLAAELETAQVRLAQCLAVVGATDVSEAEARERHRIELGNARQVLISERDGLAPDGADQLIAEVTQLRADVAAVPRMPSMPGDAGEPTSLEQVEHELASVATDQTEAARRQQMLQSEISELDQRRAAIAAELRMRRTRRDELELKYARADGVDDPREALLAQVATSDRELNGAVRERLAVQEVALSRAALVELEESLAQQRDEIAQRGLRLDDVRQQMRHVEGMLARDFEEGGGDRVDELEGRLIELNQRIGDSERHIAALRLLASELAVETSQRRDAIARPLTQRLARLAKRIWPDAEIPLTSELTVEGLTRRGQSEAVEHVSMGTREQMAVLARLAYAGLLAEGAEPAPVILDDPLVFSDDARLDLLFDTIADVAREQQIIILTCHERAFEPLVERCGATRLSLVEAQAAA